MSHDEDCLVCKEALKGRIQKVIREFPFDNYGLDSVDPASENAEWVPDLADEIIGEL